MSNTKSTKKVKNQASTVEAKAVAASEFDLIYRPEEKLSAIIVNCFPTLGKLAALRFLEWVQNNPGGVISLPTGKTPEHFIKWVQHLLGNWEKSETQTILEEAGIDPSIKPDMTSLHFVQIDEFYPISPRQTNSFYNYVQNFYINGFGLDPAKAMLIDCSKIGLEPGEDLEEIWPDSRVDLTLRYSQPKNRLQSIQKRLLQKIDQWCMEYEDRIRELGGIGFFLGGIGPDGHVGFNISGSDHYSTTRLCPINYETQAAAATDLGGIEVAQKSLVITIGLQTITRNPDCVAVIIAAGAAKAKVVAEAIQSDHDINVPATALHELPNARFYLTHSAAANLTRRRLHVLDTTDEYTTEQIETILIDTAVACGKRLEDLTAADCQKDVFASRLLKKYPGKLGQFAAAARDNMIAKIERGVQTTENKNYLHTEPHHDDVMLGYFARLVRQSRQISNNHFFTTLTSGFTSVTNRFMAEQLTNLRKFVGTPVFKRMFDNGYFDASNQVARNRDIWQYLDGVAGKSAYLKNDGCARRMLRNLVEVFEDSWLENLIDRIDELEQYFQTQYPGKQDPEYIQKLKGMCREWEAECLWGYFGWTGEHVSHLRLGFYTGDIFTQDPTMEQDVPPIVETLKKTNPDILTVAFDPEGSGPDTHYKVLLAIAEALKIHQEKTGRDDIQLWGYRNVWYKFGLAEANVYVPVSLNMFAIMHDSFMNSFNSQRDASFPSYEYDGPFSELAQKIQVAQYQKIKICLGRKWFNEHPSALIRATRGMVLLQEMTPAVFFQSCRDLQKSIES